jgi:hypothetical protein
VNELRWDSPNGESSLDHASSTGKTQARDPPKKVISREFRGPKATFARKKVPLGPQAAGKPLGFSGFFDFSGFSGVKRGVGRSRIKLPNRTRDKQASLSKRLPRNDLRRAIDRLPRLRRTKDDIMTS